MYKLLQHVSLGRKDTMKNQNSFQPNYSTIAQILTLRRLIEGIKMKNLSAILTFVDFHKTFDSFHREIMLEIFKAYGIPSVIIDAIRIMYKENITNVQSPNGNTNFFSILVDLLQRDILAPFPFIIVLDYELRTAIDNHENLGFTLNERSKKDPEVYITDATFVDITLIFNCIVDAQDSLLCVKIAAIQIGLHINATKTEYMSHIQKNMRLI